MLTFPPGRSSRQLRSLLQFDPCRDCPRSSDPWWSRSRRSTASSSTGHDACRGSRFGAEAPLPTAVAAPSPLWERVIVAATLAATTASSTPLLWRRCCSRRAHIAYGPQLEDNGVASACSTTPSTTAGWSRSRSVGACASPGRVGGSGLVDETLLHHPGREIGRPLRGHSRHAERHISWHCENVFRHS